jgi:hypothetical protein
VQICKNCKAILQGFIAIGAYWGLILAFLQNAQLFENKIKSLCKNLKFIKTFAFCKWQ